MTTTLPRKLAAILSADADNFSGRMTADETGTFTALAKAREVIDGVITAHGGRIANTAGDGLIAEFPSVNAAVKAAVNIQQSLGQKAPLPFRIGVHMGDVIENEGDLLGEGVNLAARLQSVATPGGIVISSQVREQVDGKLSYRFPALGSLELKHIARPVQAFGVAAPGLAAPPAPTKPKAAEEPAPDTSPAMWLPNAWLLAAAWGTLTLASMILDHPRALAWIGVAATLFVVFRLLPQLGLSTVKHIRWGLPVLCVMTTQITIGSVWFWIALPLAATAALGLLRKLRSHS